MEIVFGFSTITEMATLTTLQSNGQGSITQYGVSTEFTHLKGR